MRWKEFAAGRCAGEISNNQYGIPVLVVYVQQHDLMDDLFK
jgi:hypothetical protein